MKKIMIAAILPLMLGAAARASIQLLPEDITWSENAPNLPPGASVAVLEGDLKKPGRFIARLKLPKGAALVVHSHPCDERVTVLSGAVWVGYGNVRDAKLEKKFPAGSYYINPRDVRHWLWAEEETIMQVAAEGPWIVNMAGEEKTKFDIPDLAAARKTEVSPVRPTVAELRDGKIFAGTYKISAYVVSVALPDRISISNEPGGLDRVFVHTSQPGLFEPGQMYALTLKLTDRKSAIPGQSHDVELDER